MITKTKKVKKTLKNKKRNIKKTLSNRKKSLINKKKLLSRRNKVLKGGAGSEGVKSEKPVGGPVDVSKSRTYSESSKYAGPGSPSKYAGPGSPSKYAGPGSPSKSATKHVYTVAKDYSKIGLGSVNPLTQTTVAKLTPAQLASLYPPATLSPAPKYAVPQALSPLESPYMKFPPMNLGLSPPGIFQKSVVEAGEYIELAGPSLAKPTKPVAPARVRIKNENGGRKTVSASNLTPAQRQQIINKERKNLETKSITQLQSTIKPPVMNNKLFTKKEEEKIIQNIKEMQNAMKAQEESTILGRKPLNPEELYQPISSQSSSLLSGNYSKLNIAEPVYDLGRSGSMESTSSRTRSNSGINKGQLSKLNKPQTDTLGYEIPSQKALTEDSSGYAIPKPYTELLPIYGEGSTPSTQSQLKTLETQRQKLLNAVLATNPTINDTKQMNEVRELEAQINALNLKKSPYYREITNNTNEYEEVGQEKLNKIIKNIKNITDNLAEAAQFGRSNTKLSKDKEQNLSELQKELIILQKKK
jgi:hypothetical protein